MKKRRFYTFHIPVEVSNEQLTDEVRRRAKIDSSWSEKRQMEELFTYLYDSGLLLFLNDHGIIGTPKCVAVEEENGQFVDENSGVCLSVVKTD